MRKVVLASSNKGKLVELQAILKQKNVQLLPQSQFSVSDADETGLSFIENALIKARNACVATGLPAMADDSGLEVDALSGEPGIYSARYAGFHGKNADKENNSKLLRELEGIPETERGARFQCVIAYMQHAKDPMPLICQGTWEGSILFSEEGENGFGYDPLFYVPSHGRASAKLDAATKNAISHRGQALTQLLKCWNSHH